MLFKATYKLETENSRYDSIKGFLDIFHDLNKGYAEFDDEKEFFGYCEEGEFIFKTNTPASILYTYLPKTVISFKEKDDKTVVKVMTKAPWLVVVFCIFVVFAILFALEAFLFSNANLFAFTAANLVIAFAVAFVSSRQAIKIKKLLEDAINK